MSLLGRRCSCLVRGALLLGDVLGEVLAWTALKESPTD